MFSSLRFNRRLRLNTDHQNIFIFVSTIHLITPFLFWGQKSKTKFRNDSISAAWCHFSLECLSDHSK
jgi:hypothetical protein